MRESLSAGHPIRAMQPFTNTFSHMSVVVTHLLSRDWLLMPWPAPVDGLGRGHAAYAVAAIPLCMPAPSLPPHRPRFSPVRLETIHGSDDVRPIGFLPEAPRANRIIEQSSSANLLSACAMPTTVFHCCPNITANTNLQLRICRGLTLVCFVTSF